MRELSSDMERTCSVTMLNVAINHLNTRVRGLFYSQFDEFRRKLVSN
jgi:hypothetical protein